MISSCMAGIVFAKLARPKARSHTVMFSKNAVISLRNGQLWLMFRVCNMRKSHLIESHLRAQLLHHRKKSPEGELLAYECEELKVTTQHSFDEDDDQDDYETEDRTLLLFPCTVAHRIDENSPFYAMGPKEILASRYTQCENFRLFLPLKIYVKSIFGIPEVPNIANLIFFGGSEVRFKS